METNDLETNFYEKLMVQVEDISKTSRILAKNKIDKVPVHLEMKVKVEKDLDLLDYER